MKDQTMTRDQQFASPAASPPIRKSFLPWVIVGALVLVLAVVAAWILTRDDTGDDRSGAATDPVSATTAAAAAPTTLSVSGTISLGLGDFEWTDGTGQGLTGPTCAGRGGYDDIAVGAPVTITDPGGTVVGIGKVDTSIPTGFSADKTPTSCDLKFAVSGLPAGKGFYGVEVSHRGAVKFKEADLAKSVELSLG